MPGIRPVSWKLVSLVVPATTSPLYTLYQQTTRLSVEAVQVISTVVESTCVTVTLVGTLGGTVSGLTELSWHPASQNAIPKTKNNTTKALIYNHFFISPPLAYCCLLELFYIKPSYELR